MIITDYYKTREDGVRLYRTYSNDNKMLQKINTDEIYVEAIDIENSGFTYIETDIEIESQLNDETEDIYKEEEVE